MVICPPGPGAAPSSKARSCALLRMLIATARAPIAPALPLVMWMFPPLALARTAGGGIEAGGIDETSIREFTVAVPLVELRFTVPPSPAGAAKAKAIG